MEAKIVKDYLNLKKELKNMGYRLEVNGHLFSIKHKKNTKVHCFKSVDQVWAFWVAIKSTQ